MEMTILNATIFHQQITPGKYSQRRIYVEPVCLKRTTQEQDLILQVVGNEDRVISLKSKSQSASRGN